MVDYSKWKNIEISDDEDDTHPNVDTPSLFKWRHEARVQRMQEFEKEKGDIQSEKNEVSTKLKAVRQKIDHGKKEGIDLTDLRKELDALTAKSKELQEKEDQLKKTEKLMPWNVDTISQPGFSKTVFNTGTKKNNDELSEEEREKRTREFF